MVRNTAKEVDNLVKGSKDECYRMEYACPVPNDGKMEAALPFGQAGVLTILSKAYWCRGESLLFNADAGRRVHEAQEYPGDVYELNDRYWRDSSPSRGMG